MRTGIGLLVCVVLLGTTLSAKGQEPVADFQPPQVISTVEPSYPANVVSGGTVVLKVTVGSGGKIQGVHVLRQASGFTQQALEAVKKWKFKPARLNGKPVTASIPVVFSFSQPIVWWNQRHK